MTRAHGAAATCSNDFQLVLRQLCVCMVAVAAIFFCPIPTPSYTHKSEPGAAALVIHPSYATAE